MNVIITLAGHSRRFREAGYDVPKFMIEVHGRKIIERVVEMFDYRDIFHFVLNKNQVDEDKNLVNFISNLSPKANLYVIDPHEEGPVTSALQVNNIADNEEVIVSYCDFLVEWDYKRFKREVSGYEMAIPSFSGFHPASFGETFYAYMKTDENNNLVELKEKESFTSNRIDEPASVGIYYFSNWKNFKIYANKLLNAGYGNLKEGYVSLLANLFVKDNLSVLVPKVSKFICLGTPSDLEQYIFWGKYFLNRLDNNSIIKEGKPLNNTTNLIPMAGGGSRFSNENYRSRKPFIKINDKPMVIHAIKSLPSAASWIFLPLQEDIRKHNFSLLLEQELDTNFEILPVEKITSGQAATCLLADKILDDNAHLLIASIDYQSIYDIKDWQREVDSGADVLIWTTTLGSNSFKDFNAFAYCKVDSTGNVLRVVEKSTISDSPQFDEMVTGTFWFRRAEDFKICANHAIQENITINGEHYIGNSINTLIENGKSVKVFHIDQWVSFGDPFEMDIYLYWEDYFYKENIRN